MPDEPEGRLAHLERQLALLAGSSRSAQRDKAGLNPRGVPSSSCLWHPSDRPCSRQVLSGPPPQGRGLPMNAA